MDHRVYKAAYEAAKDVYKTAHEVAYQITHKATSKAYNTALETANQLYTVSGTSYFCVSYNDIKNEVIEATHEAVRDAYKEIWRATQNAMYRTVQEINYANESLANITATPELTQNKRT